MQVEYKKGVRRIYAKEHNGSILLVIPLHLKGEKGALETGKQLVKKLEKKLNKKKKIEIFKEDSVLLFGEYIQKQELPKTLTTEKKWANFFKNELFEYSNPLLQNLANRLGFKDIPLRIRKVKTIWGSCTHDNHILLNQTLVHLPTRLIKYVIIHETCHLVEKNHSSRFWGLVGAYCPNYKSLRKELKDQIILHGSIEA